MRKNIRAFSDMVESHLQESCPRSSRASTSFLRWLRKKGVDGRNKSGHDSERLAQPNRKML
jgi:hypothetical protein